METGGRYPCLRLQEKRGHNINYVLPRVQPILGCGVVSRRGTGGNQGTLPMFTPPVQAPSARAAGGWPCWFRILVITTPCTAVALISCRKARMRRVFRESIDGWRARGDKRPLCRQFRRAKRGRKGSNPVGSTSERPPPGLLSTVVWTVNCAEIHGEKPAENRVEI